MPNKNHLSRLHKLIRVFLLIFVFSVLSLVGDGQITKITEHAQAAEIHPNMFLNQAEINAIKAKITANQEPWKSAYANVISQANTALSLPLQSVLYQGNTGKDYYSQGPYDGWLNCACAQSNVACSAISCCGTASCDGKFNLDSNRNEYQAAITVSAAVRNLGLAYALTGSTNYADKAVQLIRAWALDATTGMNPKFTSFNGQAYIELSITMPGLFWGADLIWNYPGWSAAEKTSFKSWVSQFITSAKAWSGTNNYENWRLVFISSASVVAEDSASRTYAFDIWKNLIPSRVGTDGRMLTEVDRADSLSYSTYTVFAMIQTAEIARHFNVDLYNYQNSGKGLELALDFHAPYVVNPSTWPFPQNATYTGNNAALYELAYLFKQKASYLAVINKWTRPMYTGYVMGVVTLTHAYGAYPFSLTATPVVATPTFSPSAGNYSSAQNVTLSTATSGATIYYTLDGSDPASSSTRAIYSSAVNISSAKTIKAKAFKTAMTPSVTASAAYTFGTQQNIVPNSGFESGTTSWAFYTNGTGTFATSSPGYLGNNAAKLTISSSGATNIQLYQPALLLAPNTRYLLSFAAYSNYGRDLDVSIIKHVSPYTNYGLSYSANLGTSWQAFSTEFTTSGFTGNVSDGRLSFWLAPHATAGDIYYIDNVTIATVSTQTAVATPTFSPAAGTYSSAQNVAISTSTTGATIRYTLDGTTPTSTSTAYSAPIAVSSSKTIKAKAFKAGMTESAVASATYTISSSLVNLIANPGFESGTTSWLFYTGGTGSFTAGTPAYAGSKGAKVTITTANSSIQLYQAGKTVVSGKTYKLTFTAYSNTGRDLVVHLLKGVSPYTNYGISYTANLGTTWQTFTTQFTASGMTGTVNDGRFRFWFSGAAANDIFYIDDVKLEKIN